MTSPRVIKHSSVVQDESAPGVTSARMVTEAVGAIHISSGITTFAPGVSNGTHFHNAEESVIVVEGEGILVLNGEQHHLKPYDAAFVTPGTHHSFINTGDVPFRISWAYATVNVSRTFVEG